MATTFKKQFIANGLVAHVIKRKSVKLVLCGLLNNNPVALIKFKRAERQSRLKINDMMKDLLAGKTAYCLRHTFATICQQYVRPDIVDIWMGDSPQRLVGKVYTHFPDDFMKKQMNLVIFPVPTKK